MALHTHIYTYTHTPITRIIWYRSGSSKLAIIQIQAVIFFCMVYKLRTISTLFYVLHFTFTLGGFKTKFLKILFYDTWKLHKIQILVSIYFYWDTTMFIGTKPICLWIVYGCLHITVAEFE